MRITKVSIAILVTLLVVNGQALAENTDPMNLIGIGLKTGYLHYGKASINAKASFQLPDGTILEKSIDSVPALDGLSLSFPINLGSSGFGWIFDPYIGLGEIGSYGIYLGPTITFHLSYPLYLGFGFGPRFGVINANSDGANTSEGYDIYGRVPFDLMWYIAKDFGVVFEVGIGYGATLYKPTYADQQFANGVEVSVPNVKAGTAFQFDCSLGFRLP